MARYPSPAAREWVQPIRKGYKMACCDCGLVHRLDFRIRRRKIQFRVERDNRATGQMRRWMIRSTTNLNRSSANLKNT